MAVTNKTNGLTVTAHVGDRAVLLAFDLDPEQRNNLAGFAVQCQVSVAGKTQTFWLTNSLSFETRLTKGSATPAVGLTTDKAPFQLFHWVHFPQEAEGTFTYTVKAVYFNGQPVDDQGGGITVSPTVKTSVTVSLRENLFPKLAVGFTRGFVSSQAYAKRYQADPAIRPKDDPHSIEFDTKPYEEKYQWLGAHARELVMGFLERTKAPDVKLDVFAYDLDEPDIIEAFAQLGPRLRMVLDDAPLHAGDDKPESAAAAKLEQAGASVIRTHFRRFAHDKVLILKQNETPVAVLTGSANFSIRGLYVQANSVLVIDDPEVASWYAHAFDQAFTAASSFASSPVAARWYALTKPTTDLANLQVSFAPHPKPAFSIASVAQAIEAAQTSVLFALMAPSGSGDAIADLEKLGERPGLFSLGTIEAKGQLKLFRQTDEAGVVAFGYLKDKVPPPFDKELDVGPGQHIHHKFVVCDFNGPNPVVFCGSSNLAEGGEESNGDNLLAIHDPEVATAYAIEALQLFDHYRFRTRQAEATEAEPLCLATDESWTKPFFDANDLRSHERTVLVQTAATAHPNARVMLSAPKPTTKRLNRSTGKAARTARSGASKPRKGTGGKTSAAKKPRGKKSLATKTPRTKKPAARKRPSKKS